MESGGRRHDSHPCRHRTRRVTEVCSALHTDAASGLERDEAGRRLRAHGPNTLPEARHRSLVGVFLRQFASPLIYILFVAAVIAFAMEHRGDAVVILIVVFMNALIGTVQEGRAERSMESLRKLSALKVRVRRGGTEEIIEAHDLVRGDVVLLAAGDAVAADARLLEAAALEAAEAALTGESLPVAKHPGEMPEDASSRGPPQHDLLRHAHRRRARRGGGRGDGAGHGGGQNCASDGRCRGFQSTAGTPHPTVWPLPSSARRWCSLRWCSPSA